MDEPVQTLFRLIDSIIKDHLKIHDSMQVYGWTNYVDMRLIKLLMYAHENPVVIPSAVYNDLGTTLMQFLNYLDNNDNKYFIPNSGWYTLQCNKDALKKAAAQMVTDTN